MAKRKDPAAVSLGRKGGAAKTRAQTEKRRALMEKINGPKICRKCKHRRDSTHHTTTCTVDKRRE